MQPDNAKLLLLYPGVTKTAGLAQATSGKFAGGVLPPPHAASSATSKAAEADLSQDIVDMKSSSVSMTVKMHVYA